MERELEDELDIVRPSDERLAFPRMNNMRKGSVTERNSKKARAQE